MNQLENLNLISQATKGIIIYINSTYQSIKLLIQLHFFPNMFDEAQKLEKWIFSLTSTEESSRCTDFPLFPGALIFIMGHEDHYIRVSLSLSFSLSLFVFKQASSQNSVYYILRISAMGQWLWTTMATHNQNRVSLGTSKYRN